ncbi:diaminopimelate decarboxylase [Neolewinella agarilytica]|uniref:Diaminopimelate decarboxylase n=2 Tax=Neolewinella agarilytica TaxID=478744 RepID=A0A1H9CYJ8_9BACT|nr:diaminopimelate decarboxylase [Neolewinella agarilytica]
MQLRGERTVFTRNSKSLNNQTMQLSEGRYQIDGVDILGLVDQFNAPLYVYDAATMKRQYDRMTKAFSKVKRLRINYACKALTNVNVLRLFQQWGSGLDCVSVQEVEMGLLAGFAPHDILYTPNCVSFEEVQEAVDHGVRINIDNISILEQFGAVHPNVPVCIRINPHIMAGGNSKISVGHIDSKFGISIHQVPHVLKVVNALGLKVEGLHMHTGSDIYDSGVFLQAIEILLRAAADFPDLDYLDFGSGFKVPYKEGGIATDIEDLGEQLGARFNEFCAEYGRDLELMFEPGKFLVSEAGTFLVRTNVVKTTTASVFAGVDSGLNHLIRPMFYDAYHHIVNVSNPEGKQRIYSVVGYICETDTFGVNRQLNEVREGDILAMANAGAYSFMMASNYNSRYRPAEVLIYEGQAHLIRRRETMEDLLGTQVQVDVLKSTVPA